jgi:hypothetical protein
MKRNSFTIKAKRSKRNPIAATLRNYKPSRLGDKRRSLSDLHSWYDLKEAMQKPNDDADMREVELSHWQDDIYDIDGGAYWND